MFCPNCGKEISGGRYCLFCGKELAPEQNQSDSVPVGEACPWEDMEKAGFQKALLDTIVSALFHPARFFASLSMKSKAKTALYFGVLVGSFGMIVNKMWNILGGMFCPFISRFTENQFLIGHSDAVGVLFSPLIVLVTIVFSALVTHFFLMITGGNKKGFSATFKVMCYGMAANVFMIIPFLGVLISGCWMLTLEVIGIRETHKISTFRALLPFIIPLFLVLGLIVLAVILVLIFLPEFIQEFGREFLPISI